MTALKLEKFGGMLPAWDSRLLPDGQADYALNTYLFSGSLIGWRQPKLLYRLLDSATKYVYRIPNRDTNNTSITAADSFWMEFADADTTVMRTPVVNDSFQRYYFCSPSQRPSYNTYDRILAGDHPWVLGVPGSGCTAGVTVTGGGDTMSLGPTVVAAGSGGSDYRPGNQIFLLPIVPDGAMLLQSVTFMSASANATLHYQAAVYSDLNGQPFELLGIGEEMTGVAANTLAISLFTNGVSVISNTTYWIGISIDAAVYVTVAEATNRGKAFSNTYSNSPAESVDPATLTAGPTWQMWADLIGSSVFEARAYLYTWVTAYGEEGPPSEPTIVNGWSNGTWTVTMWTPEPENMGVVRNITKTRIYRSISSQSGQGTYFLVAEIPVTQPTYVDTSPDNEVAFNAQMQSLYWYGPPEGLQAMLPFPNGITVGWKANEVWFSEVYRPHAWPPNFVLTTEFPIVGIGVCSQSIVICTQGAPYVATGVNPGSMTLQKLNLPEPCLHRGSIVATDITVMYVSQNGLIQVSSYGAGQNVTEGWISRERWQALVPQKFIRAIKHATSYFAFGSVAGDDVSEARRGFTIELSNQEQTSFSIWPQPGGHRLGFTVLSAPNNYDIDNVLLDPWTGVGLLVQNEGVYYYDFTDIAPTIVPYKWRSKTYQQLSAKNFEAIKVWFTVPSTTPPQLDRNTNDPQATLSPNQYGIVRVYADDQLWTTREIRKSGELLRIYSGIKVEQWVFEVEARINISNFQVATSVKELGLV